MVAARYSDDLRDQLGWTSRMTHSHGWELR